MTHKIDDKSGYRRRWNEMKTQRSGFVNHWMELSDYILPRRGRFFVSTGSKGKSRGSKINNKIIDNTATIAARTFAAGMMSGMTSPARPWMRLVTLNQSLMERAAVKEWLQEVERRMFAVFARSNIYAALPIIYEELGVFGTGAMLIQEDFEHVIWAYPFSVGEYALAMSDKNQTDTLYREIQMTVGQLAERFGVENLSKQTRQAYNQNKLDQWITVMHAVEPNRGRKFDSELSTNKAWRSVYFETGAHTDEWLQKSGFDEFPVMAPRWSIMGPDIYGRSAGMDALGDVKQLQTEQLRKGQALDKQVNPPVTAPTNMKNKTISMLPGGVTYIDVANGQQGVRSVYDSRFPLGDLKEDITEVQSRVDTAFFKDLFLAITNMPGVQPRNIEEIAERKSESLLILGPNLERMQGELLDPLVDRTFNIMLKKSLDVNGDIPPGALLPEIPDELRGVDLRIEYISPLAQAQRAVSTSSIDRMFSFSSAVAQAFPESADKFDADQAIDEYSNALGSPPKIIRSDDEVEARRVESQRQQQLQQSMQMMERAGEGMKTMSEADLEGDNALSRMVEGAQQ